MRDDVVTIAETPVFAMFQEFSFTMSFMRGCAVWSVVYLQMMSNMGATDSLRGGTRGVAFVQRRTRALPIRRRGIQIHVVSFY